MRLKLVFAAFLGLMAGVCRADTFTPNMGLIVPTIGSSGWGAKTNLDWSIVDSSAACLSCTNIFTSTQTFSQPVKITSNNPLRLYDTSTHYIELRSSAVVTTTVFFLPPADGANGQFLGTDGQGHLTFSATTGGGASTLAVQKNAINVSSPTVAINFIAPPFTVSLVNGSTSQVNLDVSSVTLQGNSFNQANQLVKLDGSIKLPAIDGSNLTNVGGANYIFNQATLQSGASFYVLQGSATKLIGGTITDTSLPSGQCVQTGTGGLLSTTGSACGSGGGGSPGGTGTQIQYNNSSSFGGVPGSSVTATGPILSSATIGVLAINSLSTPLKSALIGTDSNGVAISTTVDLGASNVTGNLPATRLSGTLQVGQEPAHTGDVTNPAGSLAMTAAAIQGNMRTITSSMTVTGSGGLGVTYNINAGSTTGSGLTTCGDSTHGLGYASTTGQFSCQSITGSGGGGGNSALEVMTNGVRLSSPTATISMLAGPNVQITGSLPASTTAQITIAVPISTSTNFGGLNTGVMISSAGTPNTMGLLPYGLMNNMGMIQDTDINDAANIQIHKLSRGLPGQVITTVSSNTWVQGPNMNHIFGFGAGVVTSTNCVFLGGGNNGSGAFLQSTEFWCPASQTVWSDGPPLLNNPRDAEMMVQLKNNKGILAFGGANGASIYSDSMLLLSSASLFVPTSSMHDPRVNFTYSLLADGSPLAGGGITTGGTVELASTERYDVPTSSWIYSTNMNHHQAYDCQVTFSDGVVGKFGGSDETHNAINLIQLREPLNGVWHDGPAMVQARTNFNCVLFPNDVLYMNGGFDNSGNTLGSAELYYEKYNISVATTSLNHNRGSGLNQSILLDDVTALNVSGLTTTGGTPAGATAETFNIVTGKETDVGAPPIGTRNAIVLALPDGRGFFAGGDTAATAPVTVSSVSIYTGNINTWTSSPILGSVQVSSNTIISGTTIYQDNTASLPATFLARGSGATSSTFWRGDGTWATPTGGSGGGYALQPATVTIQANFGITGSTATFGIGGFAVVHTSNTILPGTTFYQNGQAVINGVNSSSWTTVVGGGNLASSQILTGGGAQTLQAASSSATVDASGNLSALTVTSGGATPNTSGLFVANGKTSGIVAIGAADVFATTITYVLPTTTGTTVNQFLSDTGNTTCPTDASGSPTICRQLAWAAVAGGGGSLSAIQVDATPLTSSATINFQDSAVTHGQTLTFSNPSAGNIKLGISGTLGVLGGGTGAATWTTGQPLVGNGTSALTQDSNEFVGTSSETFSGPGGIAVTYGTAVGSMTVMGNSVSINGVLYKFPSAIGNTGYFSVDSSSNVTVYQPCYTIAADTGTATNTTMVPSGMTFPTVAGATYQVHGSVNMTSASAGGIKIGFQTANTNFDTGVVTGYQPFVGDYSSGGPSLGLFNTHSDSTVTTEVVTFDGAYQAGSGATSLNLLFAQNTSNATATKIKQGSTICVTRIN